MQALHLMLYQAQDRCPHLTALADCCTNCARCLDCCCRTTAILSRVLVKLGATSDIRHTIPRCWMLDEQVLDRYVWLYTPCTDYAADRARRCSCHHTPCTCCAPFGVRRYRCHHTPCVYCALSRVGRCSCHRIPCNVCAPAHAHRCCCHHSLHLLRCRPCSQMLLPPHSLH